MRIINQKINNDLCDLRFSYVAYQGTVVYNNTTGGNLVSQASDRSPVSVRSADGQTYKLELGSTRKYSVLRVSDCQH